jgi:hypothetical protein
VEHIERQEQVFPTPEQQVIEDGAARVVDAGDFTVEASARKPSIFSSKM